MSASSPTAFRQGQTSASPPSKITTATSRAPRAFLVVFLMVWSCLRVWPSSSSVFDAANVHTADATTKQQGKTQNHSAVTIQATTAPALSQLGERVEEDIFLQPTAVDYKGGAIDVIELSKMHVEPASNITAAVCYKTIFGNIDIGLILQWVGTYLVYSSIMQSRGRPPHRAWH
jgi:hypothetical protein